MHQHPRPSPRMASPASSPQTNPTRTNNQRERPSEQNNSSLDLLSYQESSSGEGNWEQHNRSAVQQREDPKLNQVIQQLFYKASLSILSARTNLPQSFKQDTRAVRVNKWFNTILDETDILANDLLEWKTANVAERQPPPLIIEIYLDTAELTANQALVAMDEEGKSWDVGEASNSPASSIRSPKRSGKCTQLVLERWRIEVGDPNAVAKAELKDSLPNVYKKAVVLFKSLYTYTRLLPAWKFWRNVSKQPASHSALKPKYRILNGDFKRPGPDMLEAGLYSSSEPVTDRYMFAATHTPAGPFFIQVSYRTRCDFSVGDSEKLLSSHFIGIDDYFRPSLAGGARGTGGIREPGSVPVGSRESRNRPDLGQAYGSMSTFHQVGPAAGSSPLSVLRAAADLASSSPNESPPQKLPPNHRTTQGSKSSLRSAEGGVLPRRPSVSFQPFKAGSLSSSPAPGAQVPPSPGSSLGRISNPSPLAQARNRASLTTLPQTALRTPSLPNETAIAFSASSFPKTAPISRYSSSFGHRRTKFSSGGGSKTEDENSSGKASLNSSNQPGSGLLAEEEGTSTASAQTDDDTISDFLKLLEKEKDLKSFNRNDAEFREASTKRVAAQLSKYQRMPDSNAQLLDSMSSSHLLHRSSSSSSRYVSNVPLLGAGTSLSVSSSPGKPISPHTPHTPAVPSRLSANSVIDYPVRLSGRSRVAAPTIEEPEPEPEPEEGHGESLNPGAIDIPTSPRQQPHPRRTSSFKQRQRIMHGDLGVHSASVPVDDRPDVSIGEVFNVHEMTNAVPSSTPPGKSARDPAITRQETVSPLTRHHLSTSTDARDSAFGERQASTTNMQSPFRPRLASIRGRRGSAAGSTSSIERGATGSGGSGESSRAGRYSFSARGGGAVGGGVSMPGGFEDDEPLLFAIDDSQGGGGRASVEEGGYGGAVSGGVRKGGSSRMG